MSHLPDPIAEGLARGWQVYSAEHRPLPLEMECDVAIIGTGAGAGISAELLTAAGLNVILLEEGPLMSSRHFNQLEREAYPALYQESAGRKTADKAINILQGRCVGGSTTVNWTSSFRTPAATLAHWQHHYGLSELTEAELAPWFESAEQRLSIAPWTTAPNENNEILRRGAAPLGIEVRAIRRNVKGCWNLGSCGMGCPTNAKQSMLVSTLPMAMDRGARLLVRTRAQQFSLRDGRVQSLLAVGVQPDGTTEGEQRVSIRSRHYLVAGGAINSPALLLRSGAPDPHGLLGTRTFLHPVVVSAAVFKQRVEGWNGAPQTLYSDHFLNTQAIDGPMGFKLEAPPLHPLIFTTTMTGFGAEAATLMQQFPHAQALLALMRDGFHPQSVGGRVTLRRDGSPVLDYPLNDFVMDAARRAFLAMAEIQFAAGASQVIPVHEMAPSCTTWAQARDLIALLPMKPLLTRMVSAHVMGGCAMAGEERLGVVRPDGTHWQLENLSVHDGSLFPTSVGANPQLSIYGIVNRLATALAKRLSGRDVKLAAPLAGPA
ncbi:choline dehydrogenase-like flavoprotein [Burkholderiales bacterium JOSHI_001]|nr:choline dehydrogenase-like flavoprotein [Burkholderiales bacterium JOSHI_001]